MSVVHYFLVGVKYTQSMRVLFSYYFKAGFIGLGVYLILANLFGLLVAISFNNVARNFNSYILLVNNLSRVVDYVLFGGLYLAYFHSMEKLQFQTKMAELHNQFTHIKLQQARAQLDPHFIFNSLNTLDELIEQDKATASNYLNDFADLYRMAIIHGQSERVLLSDEIQFTRHYYNLMAPRLMPGFNLDITTAIEQSDSLIPPFTLQLLLENVLVHNFASQSQPVKICIKFADGIVIKNDNQPLALARKGSGIGLKNIISQYALLTEPPVLVEKNDSHFKVTLPILENSQYV